MSKINYDETLVRRILEELPGDIKEKAVGLAKVYGIETEFDGHFAGNGPYRQADIVSMFTDAIKRNENRKFPVKEEFLEELVENESLNVNNLRVAYEVGKDITKITLKSGRYIAYGAMPGKWQERIAGKYGEDALDYSKHNIVLELTVSFASFAVGCVTSNAYFGFALIPLLGNICRLFYRQFDEKPSGSLLVNIPYYLITSPYMKVKYIAKSLKNKFKSKRQELAEKMIRIDVEETPKRLRPIEEDLMELMEIERKKLLTK